MDERTTLDRLQASLEGTLDAAESARLEREIASDPELARLAADYRLVHALTAADPALPPCRVSFEDLERRLEREAPRPRRVAVAAGILLAAGAAVVCWSLVRGRSAAPLVVRAIPLDEHGEEDGAGASDGAAAEPVDLPPEWSEYDPRGDGRVRFLSDLAEAELLAQAARRPLLVYGTLPDCPLCAAVDRRVFSAPEVIDLAERTIPLHIDLAQLPPEESQRLMERGYPFLEVWREDGSSVFSLLATPERWTPGQPWPRPEPAIFVASLLDGIQASGATGELMPWEEVRSLVGRLSAARADEVEGRLGDAQRAFGDVARYTEGDGLLHEVATGGLDRIAGEARRALLEARDTAGSDLDRARILLEGAVERFGGTTLEEDLRGALERLVEDGRFPPLVAAARRA